MKKLSGNLVHFFTKSTPTASHVKQQINTFPSERSILLHIVGMEGEARKGVCKISFPLEVPALQKQGSTNLLTSKEYISILFGSCVTVI